LVYLSPEYRAYIASPAWQAVRQRKFAQVGRRCQKCRRWWHQLRRGEWLEVHHLTYDRLFHELLRDLQVLCNTCHAKETRRTRRNRAVRRFLRV
jgi:5-methylcytosine-specific restriction endonuclease McrA